jgi:hypothetical protein
MRRKAPATRKPALQDTNRHAIHIDVPRELIGPGISTMNVEFQFPPRIRGLAATVAALALAACGDTTTLAPEADVGPSPQLAAPAGTLLPTVNIAPAVGRV